VHVKTSYAATYFSSGFEALAQWFLTGDARAPWGYEEPKRGVRSTKIFRDTRPENLNQIFLNIHRNSL